MKLGCYSNKIGVVKIEVPITVTDFEGRCSQFFTRLELLLRTLADLYELSMGVAAVLPLLSSALSRSGCPPAQ